MEIYIFIIVFFILSALAYDFLKAKYDEKKILRTIFMVDSILLLFIQSFRSYDIGIDLPQYFGFMNRVKIYDLSYLKEQRFEVGFKALTYIYTRITDNRTGYLFIISLLSLIPLLRMIYRNSNQPIYSLILYVCLDFYTFTFSGLRQAIALGLIYCSYFYIKKKKLIRFLALVWLAGLFHKSAYIFIPAYFLYGIKLNKTKIFLWGGATLLFYIFRVQIFNFFITNFYNSYEVVETNAFMWMLFCFSSVLFCCCFYKKVIKDNEESNGLFMLSMSGATILLFTTVGTNVLRVANYYYVFIILLIPEVLQRISNYKIRVLVKLVLIVLIFSIYIYFLTIDGYSIVPYEFVWEGSKI